MNDINGWLKGYEAVNARPDIVVFAGQEMGEVDPWWRNGGDGEEAYSAPARMLVDNNTVSGGPWQDTHDYVMQVVEGGITKMDPPSKIFRGRKTHLYM
jgi:hypothetical protein